MDIPQETKHDFIAKSVQHLQSINENDEWATPNLQLKKAMMDFDVLPFLDVCATETNRKFTSFFSKETDGLSQDWNCDFFMNPPYSEIKLWMKKAHEEHLKNNVTALILVYAKTDTKWWHEFVENIAEVHFIKGRLKFVKPDGTISKNSAPYPSCWIIYRKSDRHD